MTILTTIMVMIVAIEHILIMGLEMLAPRSVLAKAFDMSEQVVSDRNLRITLSNQGIYNGLVALALLLALFIPTGTVMKVLLLWFLGFVMVAAGYGALTVTKKIALFQGLPALITFILVIFFM